MSFLLALGQGDATVSFVTVKAARAGEAGFAVAADEVRSLAMRAADAAKNTADLIGRTVRRKGRDITENGFQ